MNNKKIYFLLVLVIATAGSAVALRFGVWSGQKKLANDSIDAIIVPHHDLVMPIIERAFFEVRNKEKVKHVIIIGPNHPNSGGANVLTALKDYPTEFGTVFGDREVVQKILESGIAARDEAVISKEHSIMTYPVLLKKYFPNARLAPLILKSTETLEDALRVGRFVAEISPQDTLIVASTDFSHYLPSEMLPQKDAYTIELIKNKDYLAISKLNNDYDDSPPTLISFLEAMEASGRNQMRILEHTNSGLYLGRPLQSSTSYFTIIYSK